MVVAQIAKLIITWPFVDVHEDSRVILSRAVVDLPKTKYVKPVELIQIVKLDQMIVQFVGAKKITLETLFKGVEENVTVVEIVHHNKNVNNSNV